MASIMSLDGNRSSDPKWKQLYQSAILELDDTKLLARIAEARAAIIQRSDEILKPHCFSEERNVLSDALRSLDILEAVIKREKPRAA